MATTPLYAIVYPTTANQITPLATQFANLATSAETAIATASGRAVGLDSVRTSMTAPQRKEGGEFYSTDTKREWKFDGTNWVSNNSGMLLVWPTTVTGATVDTDGTIVASGAAAISVNGVFTNKYRRYRVEYHYRATAACTNRVYLRSGGTDNTSTNYAFQLLYDVGSGSPVSGNNNNVTGFQTPFPSAEWQSGYIEFVHPAHSGTNFLKTFRSQNSGIFSISQTFMAGALLSSENQSFDGFTISLTGGASYTAGVSFIRVYAMV